MNIDDRKALAAWALFKILYDKKGDVYEVIREFIKYTIYLKALREFTIFQLTEDVNETIGISLIEAVVKRSLKPLSLQLDHGIYRCNPSDYQDEESLKEAIVNANTDSEDLVTELVKHVEKRRDCKLGDTEIATLTQSLNNFLLDSKIESEYVDDIANFVIYCKGIPARKNQLDNRKEAIVLFNGMVYNAKIDDSSKTWKHEMTVFLDTEILFHGAGYNGTTYKKIFDDFYGLVNEINSDSMNKTSKKKIHLRYFEDTKKEIESFFGRAEDIVNGKIPLFESVTAMKCIVSGCMSSSDVQSKKAAFYLQLKTLGIQEDENNELYYDESQYKNNLESQTLVDKYVKVLEKNERVIMNSLRSVSHVFVLRKGKVVSNFEQGRYILITDNSTTQSIAWSDDIKNISGNVLCTDLYYLTDRIWCRLGKSFGLNTMPKAYDVVSRAQIILSSKLNTTITAEYEKLLKDYKDGKVTREYAVEALAVLKEKVMNPEDINSVTEADVASDSIDNLNIDFYINEHKRKEEELIKVSADNVEKDKAISELKEEKKRVLAEKDSEIATIRANSVEKEKFNMVAEEVQQKAQKIEELENTTVARDLYDDALKENEEKENKIKILKDTTVSKDEYEKIVGQNEEQSVLLARYALKEWRTWRLILLGIFIFFWVGFVVLCFLWRTESWNYVSKLIKWIDHIGSPFLENSLTVVIPAVWLAILGATINMFVRMCKLTKKPSVKCWVLRNIFTLTLKKFED